jgi:hypothetical protein
MHTNKFHIYKKSGKKYYIEIFHIILITITVSDIPFIYCIQQVSGYFVKIEILV